jgi:hypothetical protein
MSPLSAGERGYEGRGRGCVSVPVSFEFIEHALTSIAIVFGRSLPKI